MTTQIQILSFSNLAFTHEELETTKLLSKQMLMLQIIVDKQAHDLRLSQSLFNKIESFAMTIEV